MTVKQITGIVRHYHVPESDHTPYRGILNTENDKDYYSVDRNGRKTPYMITLQSLLEDFPDGEAVTITIEGRGTHPNAKCFIWMKTKPHIYERVRR